MGQLCLKEWFRHSFCCSEWQFAFIFQSSFQLYESNKVNCSHFVYLTTSEKLLYETNPLYNNATPQLCGRNRVASLLAPLYNLRFDLRNLSGLWIVRLSSRITSRTAIITTEKGILLISKTLLHLYGHSLFFTFILSDQLAPNPIFEISEVQQCLTF